MNANKAIVLFNMFGILCASACGYTVGFEYSGPRGCYPGTTNRYYITYTDFDGKVHDVTSISGDYPSQHVENPWVNFAFNFSSTRIVTNAGKLMVDIPLPASADWGYTCIAAQYTGASSIGHCVVQIYSTNLTLTVSFNAQNGTAPVPASKVVHNGLPYGALATTSRSGYSFGGWWSRTNGLGSQATSGAIVSNYYGHTLYAKWTPNTYLVSFNGQGGTAPVPVSKTVTYASTYGTLATTTREGYIFGGWWTEPEGSGTQITSSSSVSTTTAQTLYAKWTLWRPAVQQDEAFGVLTNRFGFTVNWATGGVVVVDACTNLNNPNWVPLQTNILSNGSAYFNDSQWSNIIGRFYRLRTQ